MKKLLGGIFNFVLMTGVVLIMAVTGLSLVATGSGERKLAEAPEVALSELAAHSGRTVRVRGALRGEPPLRAAGGEALAFQAVTITHEESSGVGEDREDETVTDYARIAPQVLVASDGPHAVGIVPAGVDLRFVPERFRGQTGARGELPSAASSLLPAGVFGELPDRGHTDLVVHAIREGEPVTVHGTVEMVQGEPVLRAPADLPFVVSPLPFEQVVEEAASSGAWNLVIGWALLLGAAAVAFFLLRGRVRGRRGAAPA